MFKLMEMKSFSNAMAGSVGDPDIETGADTLLSFLEEKTKWPASKIAKDLGVPEDTVKKWAKALEKSGLVEIKYSALKGMVLEYSSDKSYEELNEGRSELSLQADEIQIEAEEIEEVEEVEEAREDSGGQISKTVHKDEESEEAESEEAQEDAENEEGEEDEESENQDEEAEQKSEEDENSDSEEKNEEKIDEEEGKKKLKDELEKLEGKKSDNKKKEKVKADKAKIKKKKKKVKKKSKADGDKVEKEVDKEKLDKDKHEEDVEKIHDKVKSKSSGKKVDHESGDSLEDHLENLRELGDLLRDKQVGNDDVYSRMEIEIGALKNALKETEINDEVRKNVSDTMEKVQKDMKNEVTPPSILGKIRSSLPI